MKLLTCTVGNEVGWLDFSIRYALPMRLTPNLVTENCIEEHLGGFFK
jgi:hypothetical protein